MSVVKLSILLAAAAWHDEPRPFTLPVVEQPPLRQKGLASWYGDGRMHGRITASGEEIDPALHTCAHRSLPLQTTVLIVNGRDPTRRVWCRVNDRGPYGALLPDGGYVVKTNSDGPGRWRGVLDISVAAARELGTYRKGLEPVEIHYWTPGRSPNPVASNAARGTD